MEKEPRQSAYEKLLSLARRRGYVTYDDIMDTADSFALSLQDFDWLSSSLATLGIIIYLEAPTTTEQTTDDYDDFAQSDYEGTYRRIVELNPSLRPFIDAVRNILPPQRGEVGRLKYQVAEGNSHARDRMVEMHLRLALRIALQRAETYDMEIEDAIGDACVGLLRAVEKYSPDDSRPFPSYAGLWILQYLSRMQFTQRPHVYYPAHQKEGYFTVYPLLKAYGCVDCPEILHCKKARDMVQQRLDCDNTSAIEVVGQMVPDVVGDLRLVDFSVESPDPIDLNKLVSEGFVRIPLRNLISGNEDDMAKEAEQNELSKAVTLVLGKLTEREANILRERYGLNGTAKTLEQVGRSLGVTRERIRQIEEKALRKLRHPARAKYLVGFYE